MDKLVILTIEHRPDDVRLYHKITRSIEDLFSVILITGRNISFDHQNPQYQYHIFQKHLLFNMIRFCLKNKIQKIICVEPWTLIPALIIKQLNKAQVYYDCHEFYAEAFQEKHDWPLHLAEKFYFFLESALIKRIDGVITVNDLQIKMFEKYHKSIIRCANYPVIKHQKNPYPENPKTYDLIYVGGISLTRGLDVMIEALLILKKQGLNLKILILGHFITPKDTKYYQKHETQLESQLIHLDSVPHHQVENYLKISKAGICLLNPSTPRYKKAVPLKLLEYMSYGLPVIANDFPMVKEIVEGSGAGVCIDYSAQKLAETIKSFIFFEDFEKKMSHNAFFGVIYNRSWDFEKKKLRELLSE